MITLLQSGYYWFYMSIYDSREGMETEESVEVFMLIVTLIHLIFHTLVV